MDPDSTKQKVDKLPKIPFVSNKIFYGWVMVTIGSITQFFTGIVSQGFSTYIPHLQEQFGWSTALLAAPRSVTQVENSILGPIEGFLVDKYGPRKMVTIGVFVMGLGLILFGLTNNIVMYFTANIVLAAGTGLQGLLIMSVAVNHWFRRKRTLSQSFMLLGFPLAGVVGIPLLVLFQSSFGWEWSAIGSGLLVWAFGFPCAQLVRTEPEPYGLLPDGDVIETSPETGKVKKPEIIEEYNFTLKEAIKTRAFWFLALGWAMGNLGMGGVQVHIFPHLEGEVGLTAGMASLVWSVASFSNIPSRILGGILGDRLPKNLLLGFSMAMMAVSAFILGYAASLPWAFAYAVSYGIGWGIRTPIMNAIQGDYFGRRSQGIIRGWLQSVSIPFTIAAPVVVGFVKDSMGTYRPAFTVVSFIMLAGAVLMLFATNPQKAKRHPDLGY